MNFSWDTAKNKINEQKHGIDFEYAKFVFLDINRLEYPQRRHGEERWQIIGRIEEGVYVVIIHERVEFNDTITTRIISARKATNNERREYYQKRSQF